MSRLDQIRAEGNEAQRILNIEAARARGETIPDEETPPASNDAPDAPTLDDRAPSDTPHPNAVEPPARNDGQPIDAEEYARIRQQLDTLRGQSERERASQQGRIEALERMIALQGQARPTEPAPAPKPPQRLVTQAEIDEYDADFIDLVQRAAREEWAPAVNQMLARLQVIDTRLANIGNVAESAQQHVVQSAEDQFAARLDGLVIDANGKSDWRAINTTQGFVDWLAHMDEDADETRVVLLNRFYQRKEAERCARYFNRYKAEAGLPSGITAAASAPTPSPAPNERAQRMVSPAPIAAASPSGRGNNNKKRWKLAEVSKIYDDKMKGIYKGREAEYNRLVAETDLAAREGRIDP